MRVLLLAPLLLGAALTAQSARAVRERVDDYLAPLVEQGLFRGTVLLARGDEVVVERGYGLADLANETPNTPATRFRLMSISKTLATAAVLRLVQARRLALTDRVGEHLPEWPAAWRDVTLHDLLDHSSGLPHLELQWIETQQRTGARGLPAWPAFAAAHGDTPLQAQPGTVHVYSNFNLEVIGLVLESLDGRSYGEVLRRTVLEPLQLATAGVDDGGAVEALATGYALGPGGVPVATAADLSRLQAACGVFATAADLHRFAAALDDPDWLDRKLHAIMVSPRRGNYACSWLRTTLHGRTCYRHSGGRDGCRSDFLRLPDDDVVVVVLGNTGYAPIVRISNDLAAILLGERPGTPVRPEADDLTRWAGLFRARDGSHLLLHRRGGLLVAFDLESRARGQVLLPLEGAEFAEPVPADVRLKFDRDGRRLRRVVDGRATATLQRVAPRLDAWRAAAGPLQVQPATIGAAELVVDGDRIALQAQHHPPIELVPVADERAVALYGPLDWTWLDREGDALLLQIQGITFRFEPRER